MTIEIEGLDGLIVDLAAAPFKVRAGARSIVQASASRVKADAQVFSSGLAHAPAYPRSITFETHERGIGEVDADIGPDKNRPQGALGNLLEYGSVNNPPHAHLGPALDREGPRFVTAFVTLAGEVL